MIHLEAWYKEAVSLDKKFQYLLELAKHNAISPEDFTRQMVRLYQSTESFDDIVDEHGLLHVDEFSEGIKQFTMTDIWLRVHQNWVNEAKNLYREFTANPPLTEDTVVSWNDYYTLGVCMQSLAALKPGKFIPLLPIARYPGVSGPSIRDPRGYSPEPYSSESDFNRRVMNVLEDARKVLDILKASQETPAP